MKLIIAVTLCLVFVSSLARESHLKNGARKHTQEITLGAATGSDAVELVQIRDVYSKLGVVVQTDAEYSRFNQLTDSDEPVQRHTPKYVLIERDQIDQWFKNQTEAGYWTQEQADAWITKTKNCPAEGYFADFWRLNNADGLRWTGEKSWEDDLAVLAVLCKDQESIEIFTNDWVIKGAIFPLKKANEANKKFVATFIDSWLRNSITCPIGKCAKTAPAEES